MIQTATKPLTFEDFAEWKPENGRYELHNGEIVEMSQPLGDHEEVIGFSARKLTVEFDRLPEYWIVDYLGLGGRRFIGNPKQPTISIYRLVDGEYEISLFRGDDRIESPTFPELNLTAQQIFQAGLIAE